jgi:hypothetical protein
MVEFCNCYECAKEEPERARMCDECKADTMCYAFQAWYHNTYKKEREIKKYEPLRYDPFPCVELKLPDFLHV